MRIIQWLLKRRRVQKHRTQLATRRGKTIRDRQIACGNPYRDCGKERGAGSRKGQIKGLQHMRE
jgi:hypothetical protein